MHIAIKYNILAHLIILKIRVNIIFDKTTIFIRTFSNEKTTGRTIKLI